MSPSISSSVYRREEQRFAISLTWGSFMPGPVKPRRFNGSAAAQSIVPPCAASLGESGVASLRDPAFQEGRHASYLPLFSCIYNSRPELLTVQPGSTTPRPTTPPHPPPPPNLGSPS